MEKHKQSLVVELPEESREAMMESHCSSDFKNSIKPLNMKHPSSQKKAKNRTNRRLLREWIEKHEDCPYPSDDDILMLIKKTGMSEKQIRVWFTNYRNRKYTREETCLSRIKYAMMKKNYSSEYQRIKKFKKAAEYYLSKFYCMCDDTNFTQSSEMQMSVEDRARQFFMTCGYCACDPQIPQ